MSDQAKEKMSAARGRQAASPIEMGWLGWRDIVWRTWSETWDDNIGLIAAGVAFYAFLAIVPTLAVSFSATDSSLTPRPFRITCG